MGTVHYLQAKSAISVLPEAHPLYRIKAAVDPYAGCAARCAFCPCCSSDAIGVKTNLLPLLRRDLAALPEKPHIGLGTGCEPYPDAEREFKLTRRTVEIIAEARYPLQVFTRSSLVTRDMDVFQVHSARGLMAVSVSLFTTDRAKAAQFEPNVMDPDERLRLLKELVHAGIFAGVILSPIIPFVSDSVEELDELFFRVKRAGGEYILAGVLHQGKAAVRERIERVVSEQYPSVKESHGALYADGSLPGTMYTAQINRRLAELGEKYRMPLYLPTQTDIPVQPDVRHMMVV